MSNFNNVANVLVFHFARKEYVDSVVGCGGRAVLGIDRNKYGYGITCLYRNDVLCRPLTLAAFHGSMYRGSGTHATRWRGHILDDIPLPLFSTAEDDGFITVNIARFRECQLVRV